MGAKPKIWQPVWTGVIEGMTINLIKRNLWRFTPLFDFDDVLQDCWMFFLTCREKYPMVVDEQHFTALYKTCLRNHFHTLASQRSVSVSNFSKRTKKGDEVDLLDQVPNRPESREEEFKEILADAPAEIHSLIKGLNRKGRPHTHRKTSSGKRETTNAFLCRIAGLNPAEVDLRSMLNNIVAPA